MDRFHRYFLSAKIWFCFVGNVWTSVEVNGSFGGGHKLSIPQQVERQGIPFAICAAVLLAKGKYE